MSTRDARELCERALNEGRNVFPDLSDDEATIVEQFAALVLNALSVK